MARGVAAVIAGHPEVRKREIPYHRRGYGVVWKCAQAEMSSGTPPASRKRCGERARSDVIPLATTRRENGTGREAQWWRRVGVE